MWKEMNKNLLGILAIFLALLLSIPLVSAELLTPADQRSVTTGVSADWVYIKVKKMFGTDYVAFSRDTLGKVGLAVDGDYVGELYFVPAFKHPTDGKWYICPLRGGSALTHGSGDDYIRMSGTDTFTCYQYDDPATSVSAELAVHNIFMIVRPDASVKIVANVSVIGATPSDRGFAYVFVPENPSDFRYVKVGDNYIDLAGADGNYQVDKHFDFYNAVQQKIGHSFDWTDMPDTSTMMRVVTLGDKKGLLVGTYGYGAGNNIFVDPIYQVDYTPNPAEWLVNGSVASDPNSAFVQQIDVTSGVSDSDDGTSYDVGEGFSLVLSPDSDMALLFHFDNESAYGESNSHIYDFTGNGNNGSVIGSAVPNASGRFDGSFQFTGTDDDYVVVNDSDILDFSELMSIVFWVDFDAITTFDNMVYKDTAYRVTLPSSNPDRIRFGVHNGGWRDTVSDDGVITTTGWYHVAVTANMSSETAYVYVNGVEVGSTVGWTGSGNLTNSSDDVHVGCSQAGANCFNGRLDELAFWDRVLSQEEIERLYNGSYAGKAIAGKWNQTYDSDSDWWLRVRKTTVGTVNMSVYAYYDDDNINQSYSVIASLSGTGWFNINVSDLLEYELNDAGLNYSILRFFTDDIHNFSEVMLRRDFNDTESPQIFSCQLNDTTLDEGEVARLQCNATDDVDVSFVNGTINGTSYAFIRSDDVFYYDLLCNTEGSFSWTLAEAEDLVGNYNSTNPSLSVSCNLPPRITVIHPDGDTYDEGSEVGLVASLVDSSLDTVYGWLRYPNASTVWLRNFDTGISSDDFDTDTEGVNWELTNITEGIQHCDGDIDTTVPNKLYIELNGSGGVSTSMHCGFNCMTHLVGNFDYNVSYNITNMEDDTFFTLRSNSLCTFLGAGIRAFIVIINLDGNHFMRFGWYNGTVSSSTQIPIAPDLLEGKLRIKRSNINTSPVFNLYYWNNSVWVDHLGDIPSPLSPWLQHVQFKAGAQPDGFGALNMTLDDFQVSKDDYYAYRFAGTADSGTYNFSVYANDTYGLLDNTTMYGFIVADINDPPSRPFFSKPDPDDTVSGIVNISWGLVFDDEGDSLKFNITLLNPDGSDNALIVGDYGNDQSTMYCWDSTPHLNGLYSLKLVVYENETVEGLSTTEYLDGNITIDNLAPNVFLDSLALYYSPYAQVDVQETIYAIVKVNGTNYGEAYVEILLDGVHEVLSWDSVTEAYIVYWIPWENGDVEFNVTAQGNNTLSENGTVRVRTPFNITVRLWNNINMTEESRYLNEFAWIYFTKDLNPTLRRLFGRDMFACPPQGDDECYWHGKYVNGTATVTLWDEGNYSMYIIGNNIKWQQNFPSGGMVDCDFCEPWIIQSRFRLNLGNFYLDDAEEIDLFYSNTELYVLGAIFGTFASWLAMIVFAVIGVGFFLLLLVTTHSLKSALAGLVLLPTILYIILSLVLW